MLPEMWSQREKEPKPPLAKLVYISAGPRYEGVGEQLIPAEYAAL